MAMTPGFKLRQAQTQTQSLVMTPQLQQSIKLLQMSNLELNEYVEAELERNPLLEKSENSVEKPNPDTGDTDLGTPKGEESLALSDEERAGPITRQTMSETDSDWSPMGRGGSPSFDDQQSLEATLVSVKTLSEHLTEQLNIAILDPVERMIGAQMIGALDEAGYLATDLDQIAENLGAEIGAVKTVLSTVQTFEPAGIFAQDLKECLAIQLKEKDRLDPVMQVLLCNLDLLAKHDFAALMKLCGADREDLAQMIEDIRECNPQPGSAYVNEVALPIVPDIYVREAGDGSWHVELNSSTLPAVLVNNRYYTNVAKSAMRKEDKLYLNECLTNANWLVKSLDQRARTILKVSREIVRQQDAFFLHGVQHLKPLNMKTIAEAIEMHESTVSRATSGKYMCAPRGIFELKYFFTPPIASSAGGKAHSAEAVRQRIREMIDNEEVDKILSDERIAKLLNAIGIDIARRTVAKYRKALGIASSARRRRQKRSLHQRP